jgi:hypothetical protein
MFERWLDTSKKKVTISNAVAIHRTSNNQKLKFENYY